MVILIVKIKPKAATTITIMATTNSSLTLKRLLTVVSLMWIRMPCSITCTTIMEEICSTNFTAMERWVFMLDLTVQPMERKSYLVSTHVDTPT
jgi:hypothetical protein